MLKTWSRHLQTWMEKWGYALMCVLCAVVILLSALWTRDAQREERRSADALSGMDETLTDKKADKEAEKEAEKENTQWARPVKGDIARPFSVNTVYFEETGIYAAHMAVDFVCEQGKASISLIQRRFRIGFNKAARIIEQMEVDGIVGPQEGSKPRSVLR